MNLPQASFTYNWKALFALTVLLSLLPPKLQAQRIIDGRFLVERMHLTPLLGPDPGMDWAKTLVALDSLEKVKGYEETSPDWLNLQVVRVLATRNTQGHAAAEAVAKQALQSPAAAQKTFAKRALMMFQALEHYWGNPGLGTEGTALVFQAIELSREKKDFQLQFDLSLFIAAIYLDYRRSDLAQDWLKKARKLLPAIDDPLNCHSYYLTAAEALIPTATDGMGRMVWETKAKEEQALEFAAKAISCGKKAFDLGHGIECDVGLAYQLRSKFWREPGEELAFALEAIPYLKHRNKVALGYGYTLLTQIYVNEGNYTQAAIYLDSSRVLKTESGDFPPHLARYYEVCLAYYQGTGGPADSLVKYQTQLSFTQADAMRAQEVAELEKEKFRYLEAQQKLLILQQESELEERRMHNRSLVIVLTALGVILLLILGAWLRIRQRNKLIQQKNIEIEKMVGELEKSLEEKTMLVQEVNHRVKNNLQMINSFVEIQSRNINHEETAGFAEGIRRRIRAVGLVHELIQESMLKGMTFRDYALQLIAELEALYFEGEQLTCETEFDEVEIGLSPSMYLGILLSELVSNSMKHAGKAGAPLLIKVGLTQEDENWVFSYKDSGDGIPEKALTEMRKSTGIGLKLVDAMVRQLEGQVSYQTTSVNSFRLVFPEPEQE